MGGLMCSSTRELFNSYLHADNEIAYRESKLMIAKMNFKDFKSQISKYNFSSKLIHEYIKTLKE